MELRRILVITAIAVIILLLIIAWFYPPDDDFRVENPFWNGSKAISYIDSALPLESLSDLPPSPQGSTLILIPSLSYTSTELEQVNSFVTRGGTLILADDYGYGNQILEYLGLRARFSGQKLLDPLINYKNKHFPKILHLESSPLLSNTESLVFNHATCLVEVETASVLAFSSSFSFLDLIDNQIWDYGEPNGPLPVISHHKLGNGQIILVADPSLFINSMKALEDNDSFMQNIVAATTNSLLIDQSHLPASELKQTKNLLVRLRSSLATPLGTSGLVILVLIIVLIPIWHKKKEGSRET